MLPAISLIVMAETIIPHTHAARQAQEFGIISRTMPQNKLTSRIAAITGKLAVALAALLAPAILIAETINVTFDAALTNETGWTYNTAIKSNKTGYYVNGHDAQITSAQFDFVITSIVVHVRTTDNCSRNLIISPYAGDSTVTDHSWNFSDIPKGVESDIIATWEATKKVNRVAIQSTSGQYNLYFLSATISGVPIVPSPTGLQASDIRGNQFTLSWENPETAVSNRIAMMEIVESEITGVTIEYDFNEFTNSQKSSVDITDSFTNTIPAFSGSSEIRLPASTNGIIQISKDGARGYFVHSRFADYSDMSLVISLRVPNEDSKKTFGVSYLAADGSTNQFCQVAMSTEFMTNTVSLASVPPNAPLLFNTDGTSDTKRVVYVDYMAFIGATAVNIATNVVATAFAAGSPARVRRLSPNTEYLVTVSAFDPDGNESSPSEPLAVTTNGEALPFSIRIQ